MFKAINSQSKFPQPNKLVPIKQSNVMLGKFVKLLDKTIKNRFTNNKCGCLQVFLIKNCSKVTVNVRRARMISDYWCSMPGRITTKLHILDLTTVQTIVVPQWRIQDFIKGRRWVLAACADGWGLGGDSY
jgi:hypothetical protein